MSHYSTVQLKLTDPEALVLALQELGFTPEVHLEPQRLYGYRGDLRKDAAHIIIRRAQIGAASNDLGFLRHPDGTFTAVISDYDQGRGYNETWLKQVVKLTGVHKVLLQAKRLGHRAERRVDAQGRLQVVLSGGRW